MCPAALCAAILGLEAAPAALDVGQHSIAMQTNIAWRLVRGPVPQLAFLVAIRSLLSSKGKSKKGIRMTGKQEEEGKKEEEEEENFDRSLSSQSPFEFRVAEKPQELGELVVSCFFCELFVSLFFGELVVSLFFCEFGCFVVSLVSW